MEEAVGAEAGRSGGSQGRPRRWEGELEMRAGGRRGRIDQATRSHHEDLSLTVATQSPLGAVRAAEHLLGVGSSLRRVWCVAGGGEAGQAWKRGAGAQGPWLAEGGGVDGVEVSQ